MDKKRIYFNLDSYKIPCKPDLIIHEPMKTRIIWFISTGLLYNNPPLFYQATDTDLCKLDEK